MLKAIYAFVASFGAIGVLAYICLLLAGIAGYVMNLISLVHLFLIPGQLQFTGIMLGRILGLLFFPLGGVLGWF